MTLPPKSHYINPNYRPMYRREIGALICTTDGSGLYMPKGVSFSARILVDLADHSEMAIRLRDDGRVECIHGDFEIHFGKPFAEGHPYTDGQVSHQINEFLKTLGIPGKVGWSELGKQTPYHGDLDADDSIYAHVFPEAIEARLRDFRQTA